MSYLFERANEAASGEHGVDESWLAERLINFANEEVDRHKTALRELSEAAEKLRDLHDGERFSHADSCRCANCEALDGIDAAILKAKEILDGD